MPLKLEKSDIADALIDDYLDEVSCPFDRLQHGASRCLDYVVAVALSEHHHSLKLRGLRFLPPPPPALEGMPPRVIDRMNAVRMHYINCLKEKQLLVNQIIGDMQEITVDRGKEATGFVDYKKGKVGR